jgi:hypothetical protein
VRGVTATTSAIGLAVAIVLNAPPDPRLAIIVIALIAIVFTISSAMRWPGLLAPALASFAVAYAIALVSDPHLDLHAPFIGAALLVVGELASGTGARSLSLDDRHGRIVIEVLSLGLAAILICVVVLAGAAPRVRGSVILEGIGAVAAVGVFFLLSRLTKSGGPKDQRSEPLALD